MLEAVRLERDPVCGMMLEDWVDQVTYRGIGYAFCSLQCSERFTSRPGLYAGRRGFLAPKPKGLELIKRRRMALGVPLARAQFVELKSALLAMMGVTAVQPVERVADGARNLRWAESGVRTSTRPSVCIEAVEITYNLLQATARQLEREIVALNAAPSYGWGEKLQRDFIHYLEKCELDDLEIRDTGPVRRDRGARRTAPAFQAGTGTRIAHGTGKWALNRQPAAVQPDAAAGNLISNRIVPFAEETVIAP